LLEEFDNPPNIRRQAAHRFGIDQERLVELGWG